MQIAWQFQHENKKIGIQEEKGGNDEERSTASIQGIKRKGNNINLIWLISFLLITHTKVRHAYTYIYIYIRLNPVLLKLEPTSRLAPKKTKLIGSFPVWFIWRTVCTIEPVKTGLFDWFLIKKNNNPFFKSSRFTRFQFFICFSCINLERESEQ